MPDLDTESKANDTTTVAPNMRFGASFLDLIYHDRAVKGEMLVDRRTGQTVFKRNTDGSLMYYAQENVHLNNYVRQLKVLMLNNSKTYIRPTESNCKQYKNTYFLSYNIDMAQWYFNESHEKKMFVDGGTFNNNKAVAHNFTQETNGFFVTITSRPRDRAIISYLTAIFDRALTNNADEDLKLYREYAEKYPSFERSHIRIDYTINYFRPNGELYETKTEFGFVRLNEVGYVPFQFAGIKSRADVGSATLTINTISTPKLAWAWNYIQHGSATEGEKKMFHRVLDDPENFKDVSFLTCNIATFISTEDTPFATPSEENCIPILMMGMPEFENELLNAKETGSGGGGGGIVFTEVEPEESEWIGLDVWGQILRHVSGSGETEDGDDSKLDDLESSFGIVSYESGMFTPNVEDIDNYYVSEDKVPELPPRINMADLMKAEYGKIPDQNTELLSIKVKDMVIEGSNLYGLGLVYGTLSYIRSYPQYSSDVAEQSGYYFPIQLGEKFKGKKITVKRLTGKKNTATAESDTWILRLDDEDPLATKFEIYADDAESLKLTIDFNYAAIQEVAMPEDVLKVGGQDTEVLGLKGSDMYENNIRITNRGKVTGTFRSVNGFYGFSDNADEQYGYFIHLILGNEYQNKSVTVTRTSGDGGHKGKSATDTDWVLRLSDGKDTVYKIEAEKLPTITLTFKDVKLVEDREMDKGVVKIPDTGTEWLGLKVESTVTGGKILNDGSVYGTFKYQREFTQFSTNEDVRPGYFIFLKLGAAYEGKTITVRRQDEKGETVQQVSHIDTEWVLRLTDGKDTKYEISTNEAATIHLNFAHAVFEQKDMPESVVKILTDTTDWLGKKASEVFKDAKITENGMVSGTATYVKGYTGYGHVEAEQSGFFAFVKLGSEYNNKQVDVKRLGVNDETVKTKTETEWVFRLSEQQNTKFEIKAQGVPRLVLDFSYVKFEIPDMDKETLKVGGENETCIGDVKDERIMDNVHVRMDGTVIGTFNYMYDFDDFSSVREEQCGHFIHLTLGENYKEKEVTVIRTSSPARSAVTKKAKDTNWVLRLWEEDKTKYRIQADDLPDIDLDFTTATMTPQAEMEAKYMSLVGQEVEYLNHKGKELVEDGGKIMEGGDVICSLNKTYRFEEFSHDDKNLQAGYYLPIQLGSEYDNKEVTVTRTSSSGDTVTVTSKDKWWIIRLAEKDGKVDDVHYKISAEGVRDVNLNLKDVNLNEEGEMPESIATLRTGADEIYGLKASDLMGDDLKIMASGSVTGTLNYVKKYVGFSSNEADQVGHFIALQLGEKYKDKDVTVQRLAVENATKEAAEVSDEGSNFELGNTSEGTAVTARDQQWCLRLTNNTQTRYKITAEGVPELILSFVGATCKTETQMNTSELAQIINDEQDLLGKKAADMVENAGILENGVVYGTFYKVEGYTQFSSLSEEQSGYYLPIKLGSKFQSKEVTLKRLNDNSNHVTKGSDTTWVIRLNDTNKSEYEFSVTGENSEETKITLNLRQAVFVDKVRNIDEKIVKVAEPEAPVIGDSKVTNEDLMKDVEIKRDGSVTGTLNYMYDFVDFSSVKEEQSGHFIHITLGDDCKGKNVTMTKTVPAQTAQISSYAAIANAISEEPTVTTKTAVDTDWIIRIPTPDTTVTFKVEDVKGTEEDTADTPMETALDDAPILDLNFKKTEFASEKIMPESIMKIMDQEDTQLSHEASDLVEAGGTIMEGGEVTCSLKNVFRFIEFHGTDVAQQSGYYLPIELGSDYQTDNTNKKIKVEKLGEDGQVQSTVESTDKWWILRIAGDKNDFETKKKISYRFTCEGVRDVTISFAGVTLKEADTIDESWVKPLDQNTDVFSLKVSDIQEAGLKITEDGKVHGKVYHAKHFAGYSSAADDQHGWYVGLKLGSKFDNKEVTYQRLACTEEENTKSKAEIEAANSEDKKPCDVCGITHKEAGEAKTAEDTEWCLKLTNGKYTKVKFSVSSDPKIADLILDFSEAEFVEDIEDKTISFIEGTEELLGKKASDMVADGMILDGGKVTGKFYKVSNYSGFQTTDNTGWFAPFKLDEQYKDKEITLKRITKDSNGQEGTETKATNLYWVLRIKDDTKEKTEFVFSAEGKEIVKVNFRQAEFLDTEAPKDNNNGGDSTVTESSGSQTSTTQGIVDTTHAATTSQTHSNMTEGDNGQSTTKSEVTDGNNASTTTKANSEVGEEDTAEKGNGDGGEDGGANSTEDQTIVTDSQAGTTSTTQVVNSAEETTQNAQSTEETETDDDESTGEDGDE